MESYQDFAARKLVECFNSANSFVPLFQRHIEDVRYGRPEVFSGLVNTALEIIAADHGVKLQGYAAKLLSEPTECVDDLNRAFVRGEIKVVEAILGAILGTLDGIRTAGGGINLRLKRVDAPEQDPIKVTVTSLPKRFKESTIRRDEHGNITQSQCIEEDVV